MSPFNGTLDAEFAAIRRRNRIPDTFDSDVLAEASSAATNAHEALRDTERVDARRLPLITIDPQGSRDLDQAFFAERTPTGYSVFYAIADVSAFVRPGDAVDEEAWRRGFTYYGPDLRAPLYPTALSEGVASLLPDADKPAILFAFELTRDGSARLRTVERAVVRNHRQLSYVEVSEHLRDERRGVGTGRLSGNTWSEALSHLEAIGRLRQRLAHERGAVSLPISAQHVRPWEAALHGYKLAFEDPNDVEGWNAEISLMTGMAAAERMRRLGFGLLRALDPPREDRVLALRLTAEALGVPWPESADYAAFVNSLDPTNPVHAAVVYHAAGTMRGAHYVSFEGEPSLEARHAAIASYYAHTTAPLRRLADRYVLDLLVAMSARREPEPWLVDSIRRLPAIMDSAERRARQAEAEVVELAEAVLLVEDVGRSFDALVIRIRDGRLTVQIAEPAVRADIEASAFVDGVANGAARVVADGSAIETGSRRFALGDHIRVRLVASDTSERRVTFVPSSDAA
jgi:exoribonuclease R